MPKIPVSVGDLPNQFEPLDEGVVYNCVIREINFDPKKPDKNGQCYLGGIRLEVVEPVDWAGRSIFVNYLAIPIRVDDDGDLTPTINSSMSSSERRRAEDYVVPFRRFVDAFKIPFGDDDMDTDDALGCVGAVTVKNEEYQGRITSRVKDFLV